MRSTTPESFSSLFESSDDEPSEAPLYHVRAPGRLSILGEHIDYSGYGVFTFAIEQHVSIVCRTNALGLIRLRNEDPKFSPRDINLSDLSIDTCNIGWTDYVLCGIRGILEHCDVLSGGDSKVGVDFLISGNVPQSAGLSSSSALVCASALAFVTCLRIPNISKTQLADICARCERYVGTQGGGMDQATCLLSEKGKALAIEFNPLTVKPVALPEKACFVVMNTLIAKWKAISPEYNFRVVETKLAASILAKSTKNLEFRSSELLTLGQTQAILNLSFDEMSNLLESQFTKDIYSREDVANLLQLPWTTIVSKLSGFSDNLDHFKLRQRALHVYREAQRTQLCIDFCSDLSGKLSDVQKLEKLGNLMNECHRSCSELFECSCGELDELVEVALTSGALGSQVCGAGWGGCAIALVPEDKVHVFLAAVKDKYYDSDEYRKERFNHQSMFVTYPSKGASVSRV